nr:RhuM family protein [Bacteroides intestinalis]
MQEVSEIILYQPEETFKLEVRLEDETVWLTQQQMAELLQTTKQNISLHTSNIFKEKELEKDSVVKDSLTTAQDGKKYRTKYYSLDVIISVGYRVKSMRGTQFRQWANKVLKEYLLKGYSVNSRMERLEERVTKTEEKIDFFIRTTLPPVEGIFFEGQIFDAYAFATNLIKSARKRIILIDNYVDESTLLMLSKREKDVEADIYTGRLNKQLQLDLQRHNAEYPPISIKEYHQSHDRFLIIDSDVFHIGASLKDLGKKWFAFSRLHFNPEELLEKINNIWRTII